MNSPDPFVTWNDALQKRHLANLTFQEVRRSIQTLSTIYVEERSRLDSGAVLNGAGKRAAFAMFYSPLHFLLIRETVRALDAGTRMPSTIVDLGCGTGPAGVAWALESSPRPRLMGIDANSWAIEETHHTYRSFGIDGTARRGDVRTSPIPTAAAVIAAFTINELEDDARPLLLDRLLRASESGSPILIVEPIARRLTKWWDEWAGAFKSSGGREDRWRFNVDLPDNLKLMDKAAGLDHREVTGRSLWIPRR